MEWLSSKLIGSEWSKVLGKRTDDGLWSPHQVGITAELQEFVQQIAEHPKTFADFPLDSHQESELLTPWQEQHARLILRLEPGLSNLRFHLCPSQMQEHKFWTIYFILVENKLGPLDLQTPSATSSPAPASFPSPGSHSPLPAATDSKRLFPLSPSPVVLQFLSSSPFSSPASKGSDIEQYYDELWKDHLASQEVSFDEGIDPQYDNYFCDANQQQQLE